MTTKGPFRAVRAARAAAYAARKSAAIREELRDHDRRRPARSDDFAAHVAYVLKRHELIERIYEAGGTISEGLLVA